MVNFSENKAAEDYGSGGAIAVVNGTFIAEVSALFYNNKAIARGGAILLREFKTSWLYHF